MWLAQAGDIPWKEILAWTGGAAWIVLSYLFITNKVRTSDSAQKEYDRIEAGHKRELDKAYQLLQQQTERADRCEERMIQSLNFADRATKMAEVEKQKATEAEKKLAEAEKKAGST